MSAEFSKPVKYAENVVGRALRPEGDAASGYLDASIMLRNVGYTREVRNHPVAVPMIPSMNPSGEYSLPFQLTRSPRHPGFSGEQSTDVQWQHLLATPVDTSKALPDYMMDPRNSATNTRLFATQSRQK